MKPTDFARCLSMFLTDYLAGQRNLSVNTIKSYRDTFALLLVYFRDTYNISPEKVSIKQIDKELVNQFLTWLEQERQNSIATRNQRLAAIHAFFRYAQGEKPELMFHCQRILSMPFKKSQKATINYLTDGSMSKILAAPDTTTATGRRDLVLLSTLYDTGARVQELIDLTVRDVRIEKPAVICLTGKGRKTRHVPVMKQTVALLSTYLTEQKLLTPDRLDHPLFFNRQGQKLTRAGVTYILKKYTSGPELDSVTPHVLRHTKAMHLLQADINIVYIRDFLGHSELATTDHYAKANIEMKRAALEKMQNNVVPSAMPSWQHDQGLLDWLNNLCH